MAVTQLLSLNRKLQSWFLSKALVLWGHAGIDRDEGGFFETLDVHPVAKTIHGLGRYRRGRVIARQIYVFDLGQRMGWNASAGDAARHGYHYLQARMVGPKGLYATGYDSESRRLTTDFSLYEQAFYLFSLARLYETYQEEIPVFEIAKNSLERLRADFRNPAGGFHEDVPVRAPWKANPHMHLLEAALEWVRVTNNDPDWVLLASETVDLAISKFIDANDGLVREYFHHDWTMLEIGQLVEPGHQFEWAWLLMRWADSGLCKARDLSAIRESAFRMLRRAETVGVDAERNVVVNALGPDLKIRDDEAKCWPQTERVKAWSLAVTNRHDREIGEDCAQKLLRAAQRLDRYLSRQPEGLWHETMLADGTFRDEACKASSFYHIACALESLNEATKSLHPREFQ